MPEQHYGQHNLFIINISIRHYEEHDARVRFRARFAGPTRQKAIT